MTHAHVHTAVAYVRVSTTEQAESGAGLEAQRQAIQEHAQRRGWTLTGLYEDHASGKSTDKRGQLAQALAVLKAREADALVVAKLDRLSRSLADFARLLELSRRQSWSLVALDFDLDTSTPTGELVANIMACVAQWERRAIGQRTREGLAVKRAQGVRLGGPRTIGDDVRREAARLRALGWSYPKIGRELGYGWTTARKLAAGV